MRGDMAGVLSGSSLRKAPEQALSKLNEAISRVIKQTYLNHKHKKPRKLPES